MPSSLAAPSVYDVLVNLAAGLQQPGTSTKVLQDFFAKLVSSIPTFNPLVVTDFGARGNGIADDTAAFQKAINQAAANGGAVVVAPTGRYKLSRLTFPKTDNPVTLMGQGPSSVLLRGGDLAAGVGMLDVLGSNVTLQDFLVDGQVTVPTGLLYNQDFMSNGMNDPMAPALTKNTSIWLHGPAQNFHMQRVTVQHTGGYAVLIDAGNAELDDVQIIDCRFVNNRPHLFGMPGGEAIFGSWSGGIFTNGNGATPDTVLKRFMVAFCHFLRNTGNCLWSHLYSLDNLHQDFQFLANYFLDCGLDGILIGGVTGGSVLGNVFRRVGYTTIDDDSQSTPRWLPNLQATALDSSGLVKAVNYQNNSFMSVNGGCMDLDGHSYSALSGNTCKLPYPGEPEYAEDQVAICGPDNNASYMYGVNLGDTANSPWGGTDVQITGNSFINLPGGCVRLYAAKNCHVIGNNIVVPDVPKAPPVSYGPGGPGANQRATGNVIRHNRFQYSPAAPAPCIFEDPTVGPFVATDVNHVFGNCPIIGNGNATEFQKDPNSGSPTYLETVWFT